MDKTAYEAGCRAALAEKLAQLGPATLRSVLRPKQSLLQRLKQLFTRTEKPLLSTPIETPVKHRFFVDKYIWPEYPTHWRRPSGIMGVAPKGKAVVTERFPHPPAPRGTSWGPSAEGGMLVPFPREPVPDAPYKGGRALSDLFEGWSF